MFLGLSAGDIVGTDMLRGMAERPLVFALANPDPEIMPDVAKAARPDAIVASGRSDFANQVNNVLGFPFIFRGALDVRARKINEERKKAARELPTLLTKLQDDLWEDTIRSCFYTYHYMLAYLAGSLGARAAHRALPDAGEEQMSASRRKKLRRKEREKEKKE